MNLCILSFICLCPACKLRSRSCSSLNRSLWQLITTKCIDIWKVGNAKYFRSFFLCIVKLSYTDYSIEGCLLSLLFSLCCSTSVFSKLLKSPSGLWTCKSLAANQCSSGRTQLRLAVSMLCGVLYLLVFCGTGYVFLALQ